MLPDGTNTYAGLLVSLATVLLPLFGYAPTASFHAQFPEFLMQVAQIAGLLYAGWGRARATVPGWFAKT